MNENNLLWRIRASIEADQKQTGRSWRQIALDAKVSEHYVKELMHGRIEQPRRTTLEKLARALNISLWQLTQGALGEPPPDQSGDILSDEENHMLNSIRAAIMASANATGRSWTKISTDAGLNDTYVKQLMSGRIDTPNRSTLEKLARGLNISVWTLTGGVRGAAPPDELGDLTRISPPPALPPSAPLSVATMPSPYPPAQGHSLNDMGAHALRESPGLMPVYGAANCHDGDEVAILIDTDHPIERIPRPYGALPTAFAAYVVNDSMVPRYLPSERAIVEPGLAPQPDDDVLVVLKSGLAFLKILVRRTATTIYCRQLNPPQPHDFKASEVQAIYAVTGRWRRR